LTPHDQQIFERALASLQAGELDQAERGFAEFLRRYPTHFGALNLYGLLLTRLARYSEAENVMRRAIGINARSDATFYNYGIVLKALHRPLEALDAFSKALEINSSIAETWNNRGTVCNDLKRYQEAIGDFEKAIALSPRYAEAFYNMGRSLAELKNFDRALAAYDQALKIHPHFAEALNNRGDLFFDLKHYEEALASYDKALTINPDLKYLVGRHLHTRMLLCDWSDFDNACARLVAAVQAGRPASAPFALLAILSSVSDHLKCAKMFVADKYPAPAERFWRGERHAHDRIRVAYLSADFYDHPVAHLCAQLFELHDRKRFEVIGVSFGPDDRSELRARIVKALDRFYDIRSVSDYDAAKLLNDLHVDIAVDLTGHTQGGRLGVLAHRPAPIQVNYLGYPGTMGANFIDYIIADRFVIPPEQQQHYSEKVVYLPDTFQANDSKRPVPRDAPSRATVGLPDNAFVFCCFNNSYKVTPAIFEIWTRLLREVEGSVLWMVASDASVERNLRRETDERGIASHRIIFAPRVRYLDYLAQYQLADLFLDTIPFNGGTTASDALWSGLPIVTCSGEAFAARMAGSLLNAVGLPEMVTANLADYEALALKLARDPAMLAEIKAKLARNRDTTPLFDTARFTRHIEAAYTTMWEKWQRGEAPQSFSVAPIDTSSGK
jgi:predicted O-linked N-acetylglucosamine transferase (SPINDLY family)